MAMDNKPPLKIQPNSPYMIKLEEKTPFKSGVNNYGKNWHGFKLATPINGSDVYFASDAVKSLFDLANVTARTEFALEMKTGNTKDGNPFTIWLLNGKGSKDYLAEQQGQPIQTPTTAPVVAPVVGTPVDINDLCVKVDCLKKELDAVIEQLAGLKPKNQPAPVADADIPF